MSCENILNAADWDLSYDNCVIYRIFCKDLTITAEYIGHSKNVKRREDSHKLNSTFLNYRLYKFIRNNGGWDNFLLEIIEKYPCRSKREALYREQYYIQKRNPALNVQMPLNTKENYRMLHRDKTKEYNKQYRDNSPNIKCLLCNGYYNLCHKTDHEKTQKHKLVVEKIQLVEEQTYELTLDIHDL